MDSREHTRGLQSNVCAHYTNSPLTSHLLHEPFLSPTYTSQVEPLTPPKQTFIRHQHYLSMGIYFHICLSSRLRGRNCILPISESPVFSIFSVLIGEYVISAWWMSEWMNEGILHPIPRDTFPIWPNDAYNFNIRYYEIFSFWFKNMCLIKG